MEEPSVIEKSLWDSPFPQDDRRIWPLPHAFWQEEQETWNGNDSFEAEVFNPYWQRKEKWTGREGDYSRLFFPSAHTYRWHPVTAVIEFLRLGRFSHITIEQAAQVLAKEERDASRQWPCNEPPRLAEPYVLGLWTKKFGLYCRSCKNVFKGSPWELKPQAWWWREHEMCEECVIAARKDGYRLLKQQRAEAQLRRAIQDGRDQREQKAREATQRARRRKQLERAAYEMLSEMGILEQLEV